MNPERLDQYLRFVEERHRVWELRQLSAPQPWTADPVLATRKFTNVFRVLDPGSQFVFELENDDPWTTLARLFLYRYTNEPATWRWLRQRNGGRYPTAHGITSGGKLLVRLIQKYREQGNRVFSGAYVILPQPNRPGDKVEQAVSLTGRWLVHHGADFLGATTQQQRFEILRREYGVGPFMAMQILTDWGYTSHCGEDREDEFITPGPGAIKGAKVIDAGSVGTTLVACHRLVQLGSDVPTLPGGRTPSLMDVQNTLCEFSKYVRYDGSPGKPYRPAHPGAQPTPVLPSHWRQS